MSVYDGIETSPWLGQNPAVTESLNRLKQLEELRKQRELQTREKLANIRSNRNYGSLRKSSLTDSETGSPYLRRAHSSSDEESTIPAYRSGDVTNRLGGARPKLGSSISREETNKGHGGEHDQWFSGVTESILGPSFISRQVSPRRSMRNDRFTFSEDADRSSALGSLSRDSSTRSSFQGVLGKPITRASKGSDNLFEGVLESAFSEGIIAPKIINLRRNFNDTNSDSCTQRGFTSSRIDSNRLFTNGHSVNSKEYDGQESLNTNSHIGQYEISEESQLEESQHLEKENKRETEEEEEEEEEEFDDPVEFSQSLKNFRSADEIHFGNFQHNDNSPNKRAAHSALLVGSVPTVPPLKKVKSVTLDDENSDQYSDLPDLIHAYEDVTSVAKDIVSTFSHPFSPDGLGPRSPSYKNNVETTQITSGYDFSKSQPETLDENGHLKVPDFSAVNSDDQNDNLDSEKVTFTSHSLINKVRRTSSIKKKKRPSSFHRKGESEQGSDSENKMEKEALVSVNGNGVKDSSANGFEQFTLRLTGLNGPDGTVVSVDTVQDVLEEQQNGNVEDRVEHLGKLHVTDSLYRSGSSEWVVINQGGQADGKTVMESKRGVQINGGESNPVISNLNKENEESIASPFSGLRRKLHSTSSQSQSSDDSQPPSPSAPGKKGLMARWRNMFGSFGHSDEVSEFNLSKETSDFGDQTGLDPRELADQSVQPALIEERRVWTDESVSNVVTGNDNFQVADSSPRSDKGVLGRGSVAYAVMSDSDEAFETASDDSGNNRDRKNKAKDMKDMPAQQSKTDQMSSVSEVKENICHQSEAIAQSESAITESKGSQQRAIIQPQDHYKSPRDILGNLREIRRFVHQSVSEPGASDESAAQLSRTDISMVDAQTMTDASLAREIMQQHRPKLISTFAQTEFEVILKDSGQLDDRELYQCPHCGRMSSSTGSSPENQARKDGGTGKSRGYMRGTASCHIKNNTKKSISNPLKTSEKDSDKPPIASGKSSPTPLREKRRPSYSSKTDLNGCSPKSRPSTPVSIKPSYMRSTSATRLKEIDKSEPDLRMKRSSSRANSVFDGEELDQMPHMDKIQSKSLNQLEISNQDFHVLKKPEVAPKPKQTQKETAAEDPSFLDNVSSLTEATTALIEKATQDRNQDQLNQDHKTDQRETSTDKETSSHNSDQAEFTKRTDSVARMRGEIEKSDSVPVTDGKGTPNFANSRKPKLYGPRQPEITPLKRQNKAGKFSNQDSQQTKSTVKKQAELKGCSKPADTKDDDGKVVDSTSQFTTIVDNPFIKNDAQCRGSLKMKTGTGPNMSVWTKSISVDQEGEKFADGADSKSIGSVSEQTHEACDPSMKEESVKTANQDMEQNKIKAVTGAKLSQENKPGAALNETVSMEKQGMQKLHSASAVLYGAGAESEMVTSNGNTRSEDDGVHSVQDVNVLHQVSQEQRQPHNSSQNEAGMGCIQRSKLPAGQKPNASVVETDVDAAFEEYKASKSGSGDNGDKASCGRLEKMENVDHVAFAEKACSKLLSSDTVVDFDKLEKNLDKLNEDLDFPDTVVTELQHSPRQSISSESSSHVDSTSMTSEYSTDASSIGPTSPNDSSDRKRGKKSKSKKGFFKGFSSKSTKQDVRPKERSSSSVVPNTNTPGSSSPIPSREREVAPQHPVETPGSVIPLKTAAAETNKLPITLTTISDAVPLEQNEVATFSNDTVTPDSAPSQQTVIKSTALQITSSHGNEVRVSEGENEGEEEEFHARINLINWDPSKLLKELYKVTLMPDNIEDISYKFVTMEGLMEKLPMNKKKATLLKTWKRRFFKATDGWLHYYETSNRDKPSDSIQLMGGKIEDLGNRVIGVDDGRGRFLMVRAPSEREHGQWILAMESQTADNVKATYVRPALSTPPHPYKRVLILDIGSCSIRAGILGESPCLPTLFFPSTVAEDKQSGELTIGIDSYKPEIRHQSILKYPVLPTNKVDKFNIDMDVMPKILAKVLKELSLNPKTTWVMVGTPQNLGDKLKEGLMKILVDEFHTKGVCMVQQSLLALYSYKTDSGVIVDIGDRMEILPIYEGVLIEGGVSRQASGGQKVADSLHISLLENKYKFSTPVEKLIVRYIMEKSCHVVQDYSEAKKKCDADPESFRATVSLTNFDLPEGAHMSVTHDYSCFKSAEGFFNMDLWGMDYPSIQKLVFQAIQACPMDSRKHMYRSIYLSGGVTMLPGFAERLQTELKKSAPPSVIVEVHASPQRYHAAYIGACALAGMDVFEKSCISAEEWRKMGTKAFKKWSTSSS